MIVTFDGVDLPNPSPREPKTSINSFKIEIECLTHDYADITAILGKTGIATAKTNLYGKRRIQTTGGTKGSLVIDGTTYTNCVIMADIEIEEQEGTGPVPWWKYTVSFEQETI